MAEHSAAMGEERIELGTRVVPGGFFVDRHNAPPRTVFTPRRAGGSDSYRHCFTYAGGGSSIKDELIAMIDGAREKVFVATLCLGDASVREALARAANRLRGGVYVVAALDNKGLDEAINETDDITDIDKQIEYRNFKEIVTRGIYVRGYPGLHAKYVVVDDTIALVSSANLVTRAFHATGENGVVVTAAPDVLRLATLFARLWAFSKYDIAPNSAPGSVCQRNTDQSNSDNAPRLLAPDGNGPLWTYRPETTLLDAVRELVGSASSSLVLATYSVVGMSHPIGRKKPARPDLLLDPVRAAIDRGVYVRLLMRGRNIGDAARNEAATFVDLGVRVVPDRLNHAKGVIADKTRGALFSANFVPHKGLLDGVEVGMRLDGTPAIAEAYEYFEHAMAEADLEFVRNPTANELDATLYAESFTTWPHPRPLNISVCRLTDWTNLADTADFALYEVESPTSLVIYCGRRRWRLTNQDNQWSLVVAGEVAQPSTEVLEEWLDPRHKRIHPHGFCSATLICANNR